MSGHSKNSNTDMLCDIGRRIRELRISKGMTQSELVCEDITRNMLSRIENGAALPSLPTLCHLADRLEVSAGALLGDINEYMAVMLEQRFCKLFEAREYEEMILCCEGSERAMLTDFSSVLVCRAYLSRAREAYDRGELTKASADLEKARSCHTKSRLAEAELANDIYLLEALISSCPALYDTDEPKTDAEAADRLRSIIYDNNSCAVYLYAITRLGKFTHSAYSMPIEEVPALCTELLPMISGITDTLYRTHIEAKLDLINADYLGAKAKLVTLLTCEPSPAILYDIYKDLEFCCKCCGDFENAYKYSTLRLELAKKIN